MKLTNEHISTIFVDTIKKFIQEGNGGPALGLNAITHCMMVDVGLRIKEEAMKCMANILLVFTMNYPDFNYENAPRINVMFNAFSRVDREGGEQSSDSQEDEEDKEETVPASEKWN